MKSSAKKRRDAAAESVSEESASFTSGESSDVDLMESLLTSTKRKTVSERPKRAAATKKAIRLI